MSITEMSLSGGVIILAVTVIRALAINKLPKNTFLVLWGVAVLRLLVPFSLPSALSVYSLFGKASSDSSIIAVSVQPHQAAASGSPVPGEAYRAAVGISPWIILWVLGAFVCALFFAVGYLRCYREFQTSLPVKEKLAESWLSCHKLRRTVSIRRSDRISAPLTYGVLHPVILMPKSADWTDETTIGFVLTHEYVHIQRFDNVKKLILLTALCIHWFNPLVWVMYILANREIELSCDEAVVRRIGDSKKADYARALISMEETKSGFTPLCSSFSRNAIEERITAIMKIKKTTIFSLILAVLLVAGTATAFATSPQEPDAAEPVQGSYEEATIISYVGDDGISYYSFDDGESFEPMTDEEYDAFFNVDDVEWWTYEEFAQWLEEEKSALQELLGTTAWTNVDGEFTWTQEKIDETIAMYEEMLEDIGNGTKYSKTVNGSDDVFLCIGIDPDNSAVTYTTEFTYSDNTEPAE